MGFKELVGQVGEDVRELIEDSRQFGMEEALFQQHLKSRYPQVKLLTPDGMIISEGLLTKLDGQNYCMRLRVKHGYVSGGAQFREDTIIETKDGRRVTPEIFRELVDGKAGEGYLDDLETRKETLMQSILQSPEISEETRERLTGMIEDARNKRA